MKQEKPIAYEPHPVSAERKAELIGQGFRIVDAIYAPADDEPAAPAKPAKPPKSKQAPEPSAPQVPDQDI